VDSGLRPPPPAPPRGLGLVALGQQPPLPGRRQRPLLSARPQRAALGPPSPRSACQRVEPSVRLRVHALSLLPSLPPLVSSLRSRRGLHPTTDLTYMHLPCARWLWRVACGVIRSLSRRRGRVRCGCLHRRSIRGAGDQRRLRRLWQAGDWRRVWRPRCRWLWGNRRRLWRQASFRSGGHRWCVRCACGRWLRRPRRGGVRGSVYRRRVRRQHGWGFWSAGRRRGWRCPVRDGDPVSGHAARAVSASARCADRAGQHPGWDG
jgi:hypothetical protein